MMIRHLKNNEIDRLKWDDCIGHSFNSLPYAYTWFLDVVHKNWEALVEGDYERVMPLTGGTKFGISYLFQPYFVQQLGVFSKGILNAEIVTDFIHHIPKKYKYVDIKLNSLNHIEGHEFRLSSNKNHVLDLINDYDKLAGNYATNTKRNLKKSSKSGLTLVKNIRPEEVIQLFRENRGSRLKKWDDRHYQILKHLMYTAIQKGRAVMYGAYTSHNQICAAAFFIRTNSRLIFLFSGADETAREYAGLSFLIDRVIHEYAHRHMVLDFEGSNNPDLARFYQGFGAKEVTYVGLRFDRLGMVFRSLFSIYQKGF